MKNDKTWNGTEPLFAVKKQGGVRLPGKATHYQPEADSITLCGRVGVEYKTNKKKEVDCFHCRRTKAWRAI